VCCASSPKWSPGIRRASIPVPSELQLFCLIEQLPDAKMLQLTLKSLNFFRPVTPEAAGSSPVPPARRINDLAEPGSDWLQNLDRCHYKDSRKIYGFRSYLFGCGQPHGSHCRPSRKPRRRVVDFIQSIGNGKCVGHLGKNDARGGLAGYHFDWSRAPHRLSRPEAVCRAIEQMLVNEGEAKR
jgi:hypothetical protein